MRSERLDQLEGARGAQYLIFPSITAHDLQAYRHPIDESGGKGQSRQHQKICDRSIIGSAAEGRIRIGEPFWQDRCRDRKCWRQDGIISFEDSVWLMTKIFVPLYNRLVGIEQRGGGFQGHPIIHRQRKSVG